MSGNFEEEIKTLIIETSKIIGKEINGNDFVVKGYGCPHQYPTQLPVGKMAVYSFLYGDKFIKIGKANSKSKARYTSQHYRLNAQSTLAKSLLEDVDSYNNAFDKDTVGDWMKKNLRRIDILIDAKLGCFALELIEGVMHYKYEPRYEGYKSQRLINSILENNK